MLPERLKVLRKKNNLTQADLATKFGTSQQMVSFWEQGKCSPDHEILVRLANFFDVSVDYLLGREIAQTKDKEEIEERTLLEDLFKDDKQMLTDLQHIRVRLNGEIHNGDVNYSLSSTDRQVLKSIIKKYVEDMKATGTKTVKIINSNL